MLNRAKLLAMISFFQIEFLTYSLHAANLMGVLHPWSKGQYSAYLIIFRTIVNFWYEERARCAFLRGNKGEKI